MCYKMAHFIFSTKCTKSCEIVAYLFYGMYKLGLVLLVTSNSKWPPQVMVTKGGKVINLCKNGKCPGKSMQVWRLWFESPLNLHFSVLVSTSCSEICTIWECGLYSVLTVLLYVLKIWGSCALNLKRDLQKRGMTLEQIIKSWDVELTTSFYFRSTMLCMKHGSMLLPGRVGLRCTQLCLTTR